MKKILFIFITLLLVVNVVKAETWQEEKIEGDNVETEYRYRFYKENIVGEYIKIGQDSDYEYEDEDNFIYGITTDYYSNCTSKKGYEITNHTYYTYQHVLPVRYIKILNTSNVVLNFESLNLQSNKNDINSKLNYKIYSLSEVNQDNMTINPGGFIIFDISTNIEIENILLDIYFKESDNIFEIVYSYDGVFSDKKTVASVLGNTDITRYEYNENYIVYPNYSAVLGGYDIDIDERLINVKSTKNYCRLREVKTYRYNVEKEYFDDNYYASVWDLPEITETEKIKYIKDTEDYKIYYKNINTDISEDNSATGEVTTDFDNNIGEQEEDIQIENKENFSNNIIEKDDNIDNLFNDNNNSQENNNENKLETEDKPLFKNEELLNKDDDNLDNIIDEDIDNNTDINLKYENSIKEQEKNQDIIPKEEIDNNIDNLVSDDNNSQDNNNENKLETEDKPLFKNEELLDKDNDRLNNSLDENNDINLGQEKDVDTTLTEDNVDIDFSTTNHNSIYNIENNSNEFNDEICEEINSQNKIDTTDKIVKEEIFEDKIEATEEKYEKVNKLNNKGQFDLVKTRVNKNYSYLIIYVLSLILISLILIKYIRKMSNENNV